MPMWRKSSYSNDYEGSCVELAALGAGEVGIRDSKRPEGDRLSVRPPELALLLARIRRETSGVADS